MTTQINLNITVVLKLIEEILNKIEKLGIETTAAYEDYYKILNKTILPKLKSEQQSDLIYLLEEFESNYFKEENNSVFNPQPLKEYLKGDLLLVLKKYLEKKKELSDLKKSRTILQNTLSNLNKQLFSYLEKTPKIDRGENKKQQELPKYKAKLVKKKDFTVRLIYMVPKDREFNLKYYQSLLSGILNVRKWLYYKTGGYTFQIDKPIVEVIKSRHPAKYYHNTKPRNGNNDQTFYTWYNATNEIQELIKESSNGINKDKHLWIIYIDAEGGTGAGCPNQCCLPEHDLLGISGNHKKEPNINRWIGGLCHEFLHTIDLPHSSQRYKDSVMLYGYSKYPNCILSPIEIYKIRNNKFFSRNFFTQIKKTTNDKITFFKERLVNNKQIFIRQVDLRWEEQDLNGKTLFTFKEVDRNDNYILIFDESRSIWLKFLLKSNTIQLSNNNQSYMYFDSFTFDPLETVESKEKFYQKDLSFFNAKKNNKKPSQEELMELQNSNFNFFDGYFIDIGNGKWEERQDSGNVISYEQVKNSDNDAITIKNNLTGWRIKIDKKNNKCMLQTGNDNNWDFLFDVIHPKTTNFKQQYVKLYLTGNGYFCKTQDDSWFEIQKGEFTFLFKEMYFSNSEIIIMDESRNFWIKLQVKFGKQMSYHSNNGKQWHELWEVKQLW
ncbi:hypothetical protein M0813_13355 [Anaeramoeba flamelloides]|uniref:Uncharacterized protein n=1 Tax=Anaeramoeba flamelloides TaxID=1746091 RepID=A0ABQ8Z9V0_9EUKA|nr:hypothetical protein M0813_13355 [Anaeramoeba flamelloides]